MSEQNRDEKPVQSNVIFINQYKQERRLSDSKYSEVKVEAHLFIDICSNGETRFGITGEGRLHAMSLLEPILILGRQLTVIATE
ncbi:hypothetical protein [Burkholderia gladioli]